MRTLFIYLVFPGFAFTALAGMLAGWIERKLTARIQWRVGPPWYQSFADILKLLSKETVIPRGCPRGVFVVAPFVGLAAVALVASMLGAVGSNPERGFVGDLIVLVYLLMLPSIALIAGGAASRNTLASVGVSREMKLMIAYEVPMILALVVAVIKSGVTIHTGEIVAFQRLHGPFIASLSGALAFAAALLCVQAKLGFAPFDIAEAETEVNSGPLIEYSGSLLAAFRLSRMMLLVVLPAFLLTLFAGGMRFRGWGILVSPVEYGAVLLLITLIKNTNPRVRIDQALRFFWGPVTAVAAAAVLLALAGR
ncbi:MAG: complex I subunit 1 family protein [Chlamydiota bacterium]